SERHAGLGRACAYGARLWSNERAARRPLAGATHRTDDRRILSGPEASERTAADGYVFRFVQAGSELSSLLGRLPSRVGYQPTLATQVAALQERIASVGGAAVSGIQAG